MRPLRHPLLRLLLSIGLVLGGVSAALAFFASTGTGTASARVGSLASPTITTATPGAGTVALSWSPVSAAPGGTVTYYVNRPGGAGGTCPSSAATATTATSCTDSGLSKGTYSYTVTAVWQSWTATSASTQVTLASGALSKFSVSAPSSATAGNAFTATITAQDSAGNTVTSYTGPQAIAFSGPANAPIGTNPLYPALVNFTNGSGSASVILYAAQSTALTATQNGFTGTSGPIAIGANSNHQIAASASASQTAGSSFSVTLTAQDKWGNPTGNLSGTKSLTFSGPSSSPDSNLPAYPTTAIFTGGSVTVSVTLYDAQTTTITATDTTDGLPGVASGNIAVVPAAPSTFTVSTPAPTAGTAFTETLTAYDAYGNQATNFTGGQAITFGGAANAPSGNQPGYPASVPFTNGVGSATITLYDAQNGITLTATQGSATGHSASFSVAPAGASTFTVGAPSTATAGSPFSATLTAYDTYGNQATGFTGSQAITFSGPSSSPGGTLPSYPGTVLFTNGAGSATITLYDAQTTTLTAAQSPVTGTSGSITVSAATTVGRLGFSSAAVSGATSATANLGPITVQAQDPYGNLLTNPTAITVNLSSTGTTGTFSTTQFGASVTSVTIPANSSTTTFYYGNATAGTPTITAAATGLISGTQAETISAAPAGLEVLVAPGGTGTPSINCTTPYTTNETCTATGDGSSGTVVFYVVFVNASGSQVVYSATQSSTITETGQNTGSVTIAAGASSSSPNTLSASHSGNSTKTSTLTFGPYTLTLKVSS